MDFTATLDLRWREALQLREREEGAELVVDSAGRVTDYRPRVRDHKRASVAAFRALNFHTIAAGDSYNDTAMLAEAHAGILFRPPQNVVDEFPQFAVTRSYEELAREIGCVSRQEGHQTGLPATRAG